MSNTVFNVRLKNQTVGEIVPFISRLTPAKFSQIYWDISCFSERGMSLSGSEML